MLTPPEITCRGEKFAYHLVQKKPTRKERSFPVGENDDRFREWGACSRRDIDYVTLVSGTILAWLIQCFLAANTEPRLSPK